MLIQRFWKDLGPNRLRRKWGFGATGLIDAVHQSWRLLRGLSAEQLRERCSSVRELVYSEGVDNPRARIDSFALMAEALRRTRGVELYDVQLVAAEVLADGGIAEMQTGEGKTYACGPSAFLHALTGRGVHVATPNNYLAARDHAILSPAYRWLGMRVGLLPEQGKPDDKRDAYLCDVTYGTGHEFGFDYLRDQLALRSARSQPLGTEMLENLLHGGRPSALLQRRLYFLIVDEADHVLLDDAVSPLILSGSADRTAVDAEAHVAARQLVSQLNRGIHFQLASSTGSIRLTEAGIDLIHSGRHSIPIEVLQRTWTEYVEQALAADLLRRDVHYVVNHIQNVQIVDACTGRIYSDRSWRNGLQQAVEAKEGLTVSAEQNVLAQITWQRFSRQYERMSGITGTAFGGEREFHQVYRLRVRAVPLRTPSRLEIWPARFFLSQDLKWQAIAQSVVQLHARERPVLVGVRNIADSERLAGLIQECGVRFELLNGRQDAEEATIIAGAGRCGAVTIATNLAGRGTDIHLEKDAIDRGGLHAIVGECHESSRIDRQLIGRSGRQGNPGSAQLFVSAEDTLLIQHGTWLAAAMDRHADAGGEVNLDLMPQILRIQRAAERIGYRSRIALLREDLARESLLFSDESTEQ